MDKKNIKKYILNVAIILIVGGLSIYFSIGNQLEGTVETLSFRVAIGCCHFNVYFLFNQCNEFDTFC